MKPTEVRCDKCGKVIDVNSTRTLQRVEGWERKRHGGGANQIVLRKVLPLWICAECVDRQIAGDAKGQGTIWGDK